MATCPRLRCCSCWSGRSSAAFQAVRCCRRWARASPRASSPSSRPVPEGALLLGFITAQRLAELVLARRNSQRLLAAGGVEHGRAHYPVMVAMHAVWLAGLWWLGATRDVNPWLLGVF